MKIKSLCEVEDKETFIEVAKVIQKLDKNSKRYLIELILRVYAFLISASQLVAGDNRIITVAPEWGKRKGHVSGVAKLKFEKKLIT